MQKWEDLWVYNKNNNSDDLVTAIGDLENELVAEL